MKKGLVVVLRNPLDLFIRVLLFSFLWLQLMRLVTSMLRWHQLKWRQKRGRKACKRTSTQNPRALWNNWQNSHLSLKRMERWLLGMLQWVCHSLWLQKGRRLRFSKFIVAVFTSHWAAFGCQRCLLMKMISNSAIECPWLTVPAPRWQGVLESAPLS